MKKNHIDIITLGCSKNLVDSEQVIKMLENHGYTCSHDDENPQGEIVVVNTCGFIQSAKEESINTILEFVSAKEEGKINKVFVMGCLSERYKKELEQEIPQVDKFFGKFDYKKVIEELSQKNINIEETKERHITTPRHYAYLKISEGCDRKCAYCAIPIMTGKHKSKTIEDIIEEVEILAKQGVKELQIIAQELTYYGLDIYGKRKIAELISEISKINGIEWIRLHYAYPTDFPLDLLDVIRENPKVCKYLDIAFQHISDNVLTNMRRNITKKQTIDLINTIREKVPNIYLRTTLMVGFPNESEDDFNELVEFTKNIKFERMGAFTYSEEEGTYGAKHFQDNIQEETKEQRLNYLMKIQQRISNELTISRIGNKYKVIIDRIEGDFYIGRTEYSSPEVDPEVLISNKDVELKIGNFYNVNIIDSNEFDLYGTIISN